MNNGIVQYWRLGKFRVYQHTYGGFLALTTLGLDSLQHWVVCLTSVLSFQFMISGGCALDDLIGSRNGSDYRNYSNADGEFARNVAMKPLLTGRLTELQVQRWAIFSMIASTIIGGTGLLFASDAGRPTATVLFLLCLALTPQYSWGFRLSYRPMGGESVLVVTHLLSVLWPAVAMAATVSPLIAAEAVLFSTGFLLISLCSNQNDHVGDREVGRKTIAAMFSATGTSAGLVTVFLIQIGVIIALVAGGTSWWLLVATGPGLVVGATQVWAAAHRQRWMYARTLGMSACNLLFVGLLLFNLLCQ